MRVIVRDCRVEMKGVFDSEGMYGGWRAGSWGNLQSPFAGAV